MIWKLSVSTVAPVRVKIFIVVKNQREKSSKHQQVSWCPKNQYYSESLSILSIALNPVDFFTPYNCSPVSNKKKQKRGKLPIKVIDQIPSSDIASLLWLRNDLPSSQNAMLQDLCTEIKERIHILTKKQKLKSIWKEIIWFLPIQISPHVLLFSLAFEAILSLS